MLLATTCCGFFRKESFAHASNIAFSILALLFPFIILLTGIAGYYGGEEIAEASAKGTGGIFTILPEVLAQLLRVEIKSALTGSQTRVIAVGTVLIGIVLTMFVEALRISLNYAYRMYDTRHFLIRRLEGIIFVLIISIAISIFCLFVVTQPNVWQAVTSTGTSLELYRINHIQLLLIGLAITFLFLLLTHSFLPANKQRIESILLGVFLTTALYAVAWMTFSYYLSHFSSYATIYAGLARAITLLIFCYVIGLIFLLGCEINYALTSCYLQHGTEHTPEIDGSSNITNSMDLSNTT